MQTFLQNSLFNFCFSLYARVLQLAVMYHCWVGEAQTPYLSYWFSVKPFEI
jgi:hypothetical protein